MKTAEPSQAVEMEFGGRLYGDPQYTIADRTVRAAPPEIGVIFIEDIKKTSNILSLPAVPTRGQILEAYAADIESLQKRRAEADTFMFAVLDCAMSRSSLDNEKQSKENEMLLQLLFPLGIDPGIELTAERSALPTDELTAWLKVSFVAETDRIARRVASMLDYLAEHNVIGLVDWKAADVCKFHYFMWSAEHKDTTARMQTGDIMKWNTLTTIVTNKTKLSRTRHTHHVVNAALHRVSDYERRLPERVDKLVLAAPEWLKPHLMVIDGIETLTEEFTTVAETSVSRKVHSVHRYDPAIALGKFTLAGWLESEIPAVKEVEKKDDLEDLKVIGYVVAAVIAAIAIACVAINWVNTSQAKAHAAYVATKAAPIVTKKGEKIQLPIDYPLTFAGRGSMQGQIRLQNTVWNGTINDQVWKDFALPDRWQGYTYGDMDLRQAFNIPIIIHVQRANEDELRYNVEELER